MASLSTVFFVFATLAHASVYSLQTDLTATPKAFYDSFDFFTGNDPTNGYVNYVGRKVAARAGVIGYSPAGNFNSPGHSMLLGANHNTTVTNPRGRSSVRLTSKAVFNAGTLFIADIKHIPETCGSWPALWLLGDGTWPNEGELDWIENGNALAQNNLMSLHTNAGCAISPSRASKYTGQLQKNIDCNAYASKDNSGCSIKAGPASFGPGFNAQGGGVYVLEWVNQGFNVWFFPRHGHMPASLLSKQPNTAEFGKPVAQFAGRGCDFKAHFKNMRLIINTTFCGGWGSAAWTQGCAAKTGVATCVEYVKKHAKDFSEAYWEINGLRAFKAAYGQSENVA